MTSADIIRGSYAMVEGGEKTQECLLVKAWVQKIRKQQGRQFIMCCNCIIGTDLEGNETRNAAECFVCEDGLQPPQMEKFGGAELVSILRRAGLQRHTMKRYFIYRLYNAYDRFLGPGREQAVGCSRLVGWEDSSTMITKYTADWEEISEESLGNRTFIGPLKSVRILSREEKEKYKPQTGVRFDLAPDLNKIINMGRAPPENINLVARPKGRPKGKAKLEPRLLNKSGKGKGRVVPLEQMEFWNPMG
jgi:hypothetical protein